MAMLIGVASHNERWLHGVAEPGYDARLPAWADYVQGLLCPEVPKLEFGRAPTASEAAHVHGLKAVWPGVATIERGFDVTEADYLVAKYVGILNLHAVRNRARKGFDISVHDEVALIALYLHRLGTGSGLGRARLSARSGFVSMLELQRCMNVGVDYYVRYSI